MLENNSNDKFRRAHWTEVSYNPFYASPGYD